jgi:hypothetical protein
MEFNDGEYGRTGACKMTKESRFLHIKENKNIRENQFAAAFFCTLIECQNQSVRVSG